MEKKKIAFIFIGLFIFGFIVGVSQSKEKILADRQAKEDRKIASQQRLEAEYKCQYKFVLFVKNNNVQLFN